MFDWWRRLSRAQVLTEQFPEAFRALIAARVPLAGQLTAAEQSKLEALEASSTVRCVEDLKNHRVALFRDPWSLENAAQKYPELKFESIAPLD